MLEALLSVQSKKVLGLNAIAFKTSSATATTITTSQLGSGFTTEYSIDGGAMATSGASFIIPSGTHEVALKLNVTTGILLNMIPFKDIITEVTDWEGLQLPNIRFSNCTKLTKVPAYLPAAITDTSYMFNGCATFNQDISTWNTGSVTNMNAMFNNCKVFNQYIGGWDTSNVTRMYFMFNGCSAFNQDIGNWDTGQVTNMSAMLQSCSSFNQNISNWNVSRVTDMSYMLQNCKAFNQDLSSMVFKSSVTRTSYDVGTTAWLSAYRPKFTG